MDFDELFRRERPRALATLIRLLGDFDLAEEMLQEALALACERWPQGGVPQNPRAWLVSTARHKGIDRLRRERNFDGKRGELRALLPATHEPEMPSEDELPDDRLRLIFTCCHPALPLEGQIALTLKTLCGLEVPEIARAFLVPGPTMAQRLVRAKSKIRSARIPYAVPERDRLGERLEGVLRVVYLVFTEGYSATAGGALVRADLCDEAIRLARLLAALLPQEPEPTALLALLLLQDSRRAARLDELGDLLTLEQQDRSRWNRAEIREGKALARRALSRVGPRFYALQAAIAALHAEAVAASETDWPQIVALYEILARLDPSPVVALNQAAAIGMARGPEAGLERLASIEASGELAGYHLLPASQADLLRRAGRFAEAAAAYRRALDLVSQETERRYLERRLAEAQAAASVH
jgi:RNA polymerase sigma-70 factor (ECF subfamily)